MAQIICNNVSLGYEDRRVCENLNFEVNKGDYLCIVGDNGSGKSTLMKALLSYDTVLGGELKFGDSLSRKDIGYLPQQSEAQKAFQEAVQKHGNKYVVCYSLDDFRREVNQYLRQ